MIPTGTGLFAISIHNSQSIIEMNWVITLSIHSHFPNSHNVDACCFLDIFQLRIALSLHVTDNIVHISTTCDKHITRKFLNSDKLTNNY